MRLLPLFLFISLAAGAQTIDDLRDTSKATSIFIPVKTEFKPTLDTIPCIMLVCDTAKYEGAYISMDGTKPLARPSPSVWWQFGYEVKEMKYSSVFDGGSAYWGIVGYLDQNRKPIPSSVVVWMSREIDNYKK